MSNWLTSIAPTVASALGGPLAGIAVSVLAKHFEVDTDDVQKIIDSGKMTAEQLTQVKAAEIELKGKELELGLKFEELAVNDRISARDLQKNQPSKLVPALAIMIVATFLVTSVCVLAGLTHIESALAGTLIGYISAKAEQVVSFYFGSSNGSQKKDELLYRSTPIDK